MKIAILSDIHANLPALEAVLQSLDTHKPDAVYCLGDLVGYHVWPNEVIAKIRERRIATLAGNHDVKAKKVWHDGSGGSNYAYAVIGQDEMQYLNTLPAHIRLEFMFNNQPLNILMVHGSPYSNKEYLLEDKDETEFRNIFTHTNAHVLLFGHSHKPYHRVLQSADGDGQFLHAINAGSVGKPKDGDPRACYTLLTLNENCSLTTKDAVNVQFVRVAYDIEKAVAGIQNSVLPTEFADMLRNAY